MAIGMGAAILGSAVLGAGANALGASSAKKSANKANAANNALQDKIYGENKAALASYQGQGVAATGAIGALLGFGGDFGAQNEAFKRFRDATGYQFRVDEGMKGVTAALGQRGGLESGAARKALTQYGQNIASDEFGRYYAALTGQQGVGLSAASAQAGVSQNYGANVTANNNNAANASGNAALSTASGINSTLASGLSAYAFQNGMRSSYGAPR